MVTINAIIAMAAQMVEKSAFLNCNLEEEVHVDHPPSVVVLGLPTKVCRLMKALYGLKP